MEMMKTLIGANLFPVLRVTWHALVKVSEVQWHRSLCGCGHVECTRILLKIIIVLFVLQSLLDKVLSHIGIPVHSGV